MEIIKGGVTSPKGFLAAGVYCGLKKNKNKKDMALIYSETECDAVAVYTQNKVKGQPLQVTMENLSNKKAQAIIINSGNANTCTGEQGYKDAKNMTKLTAKNLNIDDTNVLVASTGVIGVMLDMEAVNSGINDICTKLSRNGHIDAREAIMTTDTIKKEIAVTIEIDGTIVTIAGMAKGSGMIHPNMATMLSFITTDVNIDVDLLQEALSNSVTKTYNMISVDGDTSTNDMVAVLANGKANNSKINEKNEAFKTFYEALNFVNTYLAKQIARDGEGATKLVEVNVSGAKTLEEGKIIAKSIITSNLVKTAVFGADANWGRVLCAIGYADADTDPNKVSVSYESAKGYLNVYEKGVPITFDEEKAKEILNENEIFIDVDIDMGNFNATAWGCDLSYEYVRINGDYRS